MSQTLIARVLWELEIKKNVSKLDEKSILNRKLFSNSCMTSQCNITGSSAFFLSDMLCISVHFLKPLSRPLSLLHYYWLSPNHLDVMNFFAEIMPFAHKYSKNHHSHKYQITRKNMRILFTRHLINDFESSSLPKNIQRGQKWFFNL